MSPLLFLALAQPAAACGGLVTPDMVTKIAASDAQQALFEIEEASVTVTYRVRYLGDADDFAWIIPVPGEVQSVEEGSDTMLDMLNTATAPQVEWDAPDAEAESGGCSCLAQDMSLDKAGGDRGNFTDSGSVEVLGEGFAGDYSYQVLSATGTGAMSGWLADNGYDGSISADSISAYENDALGFVWIAVTLRPDVPVTADGGVVLKPLQITYGAAADGAVHALFPSRMAASTQLSEIRNEIFVIADQRVTAAGGWTSEDNAGGGVDVEGKEGDDPSELYDALLRSRGAAKGLWTAWGGTDENISDRYITRLDTLVAPGTNTSDLVLQDAEDQPAIRTLIYMPQAYDTGYGAIVAPLALALGWKLRRRR
ncbi:MAG: DUF2330 domain-containing protein [Deltaproteobacteria bacterium]|nr:DUF2330 domain-containing protein [Deltaproteobacteria bacterium]